MKDNKDRDEVLAAVNEDGQALGDADESFKKDREIVMAAVKQNGLALEYADESLKKDREIVLAAVKQYALKTYGFAIKYADGSFIPAALNPIEKKIYEKLESLITSNKSIDALGSFDEDPDNHCIQSWLVEFILNKGLHKDIFESGNYKKEDIEELETMLGAEGGGFRPTVLLDYDDNPDFYGVAESAEGDFNDLECKATFYAGIIAGQLGFDISPIIDYWEEWGQDDDIKVLKTLIAAGKLKKG